MTLKDRYASASLPTKIILGLAATFLLIVVYLLLSGGWDRLVSSIKDKAFAGERVRYEQQIDKEREEKAALHALAEREKQLAEEIAAENAKLEAVIQALGQEAAKLKEKADAEDQKFVTEQLAIGADVDVCERTKRICTRLKIRPEKCPCE